MSEKQQDPRNLGRVVRKIRKDQGWNQARLSELSGLSQGYVSKIEQGQISNPSGYKLASLALALGMTSNELMQLAGHLAFPEGLYQSEPSEIRAMSLFKLLPSHSQQTIIEIMSLLIDGHEFRAIRNPQDGEEDGEGACPPPSSPPRGAPDSSVSLLAGV